MESAGWRPKLYGNPVYENPVYENPAGPEAVAPNDGETGDYGFGPDAKVRIPKEEGVPVAEIPVAPYVATPTTGVVRRTTFRSARRLQAENRRRA